MRWSYTWRQPDACRAAHNSPDGLLRRSVASELRRRNGIGRDRRKGSNRTIRAPPPGLRKVSPDWPEDREFVRFLLVLAAVVAFILALTWRFG